MRWFFYKALEWIRLLCGVMPRSGFGKHKIFLFVHYFAVLVIAVLLAFGTEWINQHLWAGPKQLDGWLKDYFWGVVFVNLYLIVRIVLYLVAVLGIEEHSEFPDIEEDWNQVVEALDHEKLHVSDLPLFIVNGLTPQQEHTIFRKASRISWKAIAPKGNSAVMRAYINDHQEKGAVFLCCTFVGATNLQQGKEKASSSRHSSEELSNDFDGTIDAGRLGEMISPGPTPDATSRSDDMAFANDSTDVDMASGMANYQPPAPRPEHPSENDGGGLGGFLGTLAPGGLDQAMGTMQGLRVGPVETKVRKQLEPLSELETMMGVRRMAFLCQLIVQARGKVVPINGLLQAIPYSWGQSVANAENLAPALRADVAAIHESLQLQFPVIVVTTELDDVTDIKEFITRGERLQPGFRNSRAGHRFAPGADVDARGAKWVVDGAIQWFRGWVYAAFAQDLDSTDNRNLFHMLCEVSQRQKALKSLLWRSLSNVSLPPLRLYGNYFWASGTSNQRQAFVQGVLTKMVEVQGDVAYTPQARKKQQRHSIVGWILFALSGILAVASIVLMMKTFGEPGS